MKSSKTYKKNRWNILFIGEHGKVVPIKYFKGIVSVLGLLFIVLIVAVAVLVYLSYHQAERIQALERDLAQQVDENRTLKEEKDRVMAHVVILEAKLKSANDTAQKDPLATEPAGANPKKQSMNAAKSEAAAPEGKAKEKTKKPAPKNEITESDQVVADPVNITAENLIVCQEPDSNLMRVEFKVMNLGPKGAPVSGRAVIVLKKDDMDPTDWLVLPNVPMLDRKPEGRRGRLFRIYNFRTLKFKVNSPASPDQFEYATIYTYTDDGEMLLERDYPLELTSICP